MILNKITFSFAILFFTIASYAQIATPQVLSSNMVLQQGQKVPVWGTAGAKEIIHIFFDKQHIKVKADFQGNWKTELQPMKANKIPQKMIIKGRNTNIVYDNILIGEVWLCSGQSNMEYRMKLYSKFVLPAKGEDLAGLELTKPDNPMIRVFNCSRDSNKKSTWEIAGGESLENTSVVGYFFGKDLQHKLNIPVGIITSAIGGTRIESWTTTEAYQSSPLFATQLKANNGKIDGFGPGNWYKIMIEPLVPFAVKGILWYQGENNCGIGDKQYDKKMQVMVESWRNKFEIENAPFYYVLLAPHIYSDRLHKGTSKAVTAADLPFFRIEQIKAKSLIPNSEFVTITDLVDDIRDIHPSYKWEVGARLARVALAKTYGFNKIIWSGPRVSKTEVNGDSVIVTFDYCGEGLKTNDGKRILWFEIAAKDNVFVPAITDIVGIDKVVVSNPDISQPAKVRFAWHETAVPNLVNSEGLPATPFGATE
ncbi:hypothetical protein B6A10_11655 [Flavobacterium sp. L1I52]|uniref:Sialate O-acetylesterase domain-containing protein n=1 Tax=Flavobacterium pokkalii TaxID=1940408 RepID=A0ABR7USF9_9FLAO|nr:sialate O-acetylesterase [Flavobacterium pokkalii]MBD0725837.1 hypothetical protein [Flavobacterium pokkalii]